MLATSEQRSPRPALNAALWTAQALLFLAFFTFGLMKSFMPIEKLAAMWTWPGQVPVWFLRTLGVIDAAGGIGVLLPSVTRIKPTLTIAAAIGCTILQIFAIIFHLSRGEAAVTPLNFILLALAAFLLWGRWRAVPLSGSRKP